MSVQTEFPKEYVPCQKILDTLTNAGFIDDSWHNNEYPSWRLADIEASLFINVVDDSTGFTYCVLSDQTDDGETLTCFKTNNIDEAIAEYLKLKDGE